MAAMETYCVVLTLSPMNYVKRFFDEGITPADCKNKDSEEMQLEFQAGKFAMMPLGFVRIGTNKAQASFDRTTIKVASIPTGSWIDGWHAKKTDRFHMPIGSDRALQPRIAWLH